jgi:hypothetical protein
LNIWWLLVVAERQALMVELLQMVAEAEVLAVCLQVFLV